LNPNIKYVLKTRKIKVMRFTSKQSRMRNIYYSFNSHRGFTTNNFLWLPITIDGETRWLEKTKILWRISQSSHQSFISGKYSFYWRPWRFKD
jgi:hypothetical protein